MITGELRNKIDRIWEIFWTGGITMEQSVKDILADDFWIMPATPEYVDKRLSSKGIISDC